MQSLENLSRYRQKSEETFSVEFLHFYVILETDAIT